jgi:hypothetical protein
MPWWGSRAQRWRERGRFWATRPSWTLTSALTAEALVGTVLALVGMPGLQPLGGWHVVAIFGSSLIACLGLNDAVKVAMIRWRMPAAAARGAPLDAPGPAASRP